MAISRKYFADINLMLTLITGELNDKDLREYIDAFNEETEHIDGLRELADVRGAVDLKNLTVKGTTDSAKVVLCRPDFITALLVNESSLMYGMARVFHTFLEEKRKAIRIFRDIGEALSWLAKDEKEKSILMDRINSVR